MKMTDDKIQAVASMLTDDPDVLVNEQAVLEWWGKGSQLPPELVRLSAVSGIKDPAQLQDLKLELDAFARMQPRLARQGEEALLQAFIQYKQTKRLPGPDRDPKELDAMGRDFRSAPDRVVGPGRLQ